MKVTDSTGRNYHGKMETSFTTREENKRMPDG